MIPGATMLHFILVSWQRKKRRTKWQQTKWRQRHVPCAKQQTAMAEADEDEV